MRLIKLSEVMNMTALSRATIYRKMEAGEFPQRINLGARNVAWEEGEVHEWVEEMVANSRVS